MIPLVISSTAIAAKRSMDATHLEERQEPLLVSSSPLLRPTSGELLCATSPPTSVFNRRSCLEEGEYFADEHGALRTSASGFYSYTLGKWEKEYDPPFTDMKQGEPVQHDLSNGYRYNISVSGCELREFSAQFFCDTMHALAERRRGQGKLNASSPAPSLMVVGDSIVGNQVGSLWSSEAQLRRVEGKGRFSDVLEVGQRRRRPGLLLRMHRFSACGVAIRTARSDKLRTLVKDNVRSSPRRECFQFGAK